MFELCKVLRVRHPRYLLRVLSRDELLDWLAVYEISPWGPEREDLRTAVGSLWARGAEFEKIRIEYPHVENVDPDAEDEQAIASILAARDAHLAQRAAADDN